MNSLLKSVRSTSNERNKLIKESLRQQLNVSVTEVRENGEDLLPIENCEETTTLCFVLEAIFLHGLKDSLLNRVTEALGGPDFEAIPQPSFWGPLLVFSHREIISRVQSFARINTEVGYCRAWIRLALNECLLSSYLNSIGRDSTALKPYYDRRAFIRDPDYVDAATRLVERLERETSFELVCNSSLLNHWSSTPLLIAGIWSPPMKACPILSAVDIAKTINSGSGNEENEDIETAASSIGSFSSLNSLQRSPRIRSAGDGNGDEARKVVIEQREERSDSPLCSSQMENFAVSTMRTRMNEPRADEANLTTKDKRFDRILIESFVAESSNSHDDQLPFSQREIAEGEENLETGIDHSEMGSIPAIGNSLIGRPGWSTSFEDADASSFNAFASTNQVDLDSTIDVDSRTPGEGTTYEALIKSYHMAGYSSAPANDPDEFLLDDCPNDDGKTISRDVIAAKSKFENKLLDNMEEQIGNLPRERGLDVQNYSCYDCLEPIGMTFGRIRVCSFTGNYYCNDCMSNVEFVIPSRIIHNWDFKHYPVCRRAADYLADCSTLLNLKTLNPRIYTAVDGMAQLQSLRIRLNLLRAYLFTCREPIIESLQKRVSPREYIYEHVHQYSVADLIDVPSGVLAQQLQKIVDFARNHVLGCWLCSQKGFICEVCNNSKVIYPFDMETTYKCNVCNAVFHADCQSSSKPCPKCKRRRMRADRPPAVDVDSIEFQSSSENAIMTSTNAI